MRQSVLDHVNGRYEEAAHRLAWLYKLLKPRIERTDNSAPLIGDDTSNIDVVPDDDFQELRVQVAIQIKRLELGLDAYGNPPSFVPTLNYESYANYSDRWLKSAEKIEALHEQYYQENQEQNAGLIAAREAVNNLDSVIVDLNQDIFDTERRREGLHDDIKKMLDGVQNAAAKILRTSEAFKEAVRRQGRCGIGDLIKGASAIVALSQGSIAAVAAVGPVIEKIKADESDTFKYLGAIAQKVEIVGKEVNKVEGAYQKLKSVFEKSDLPDAESDGAKIIAEREAILKKIAPYRNMPEAQDYVRAIDSYIDLVFARNAKIMEHDALILHVKESQSKIAQAKQDQNTLKTKVATTTKPYLPELEEFMNRSLDMHKTELVRALYYTQRALAYMTLTDHDVDLTSRQKVGQLEHKRRMLDKRLQDANEAKGRGYQILEMGQPLSSFSLKQLVRQEGIDRLISNNSVDFTLPMDSFPDAHHVYVSRVSVIFNGLRNRDREKVGITLVHSGHAKFFDKNGALKQFVHASRPTTVYENDNDGSSLGDDKEFIALTPYGPWRANIGLQSNKGINFSKLRDVQMQFEVKYLPNDL